MIWFHPVLGSFKTAQLHVYLCAKDPLEFPSGLTKYLSIYVKFLILPEGIECLPWAVN